MRTDPEQAGILDLCVAFDWLWDFYKIGDNGGHEKTWSGYGYYMIYELHSKGACGVYMSMLDSYVHHNSIDDDVEKYSAYATNITGNYHLYGNDTYKDALNYMLMLLRKLWQDGPANKRMSHDDAQELRLVTDKLKDPRLEQQTDKELQFLRELSKDKNSNAYQFADTLFYQIKKLQQPVQNYDGKILIWDSY